MSGADISGAQPDQVQAFITSLYALARRGDRAALATLRRGLGKQPSEAREMSRYVMPYCGRLSWWRQRDYFLVASLFAIHRGMPVAAAPSRANLGASYRVLAWAEGGPRIERRFLGLLGAARDDLAPHLRYAVSMMKIHKVMVDWAQLLRDLEGWDDDPREAQRRWSESFWGGLGAEAGEPGLTASAPPALSGVDSPVGIMVDTPNISNVASAASRTDASER